MIELRTVSLATSLLLAATLPALAGTTISNPAKNAKLPADFKLVATTDGCSNHPVIAIGYSFDDNTDTKIVRASAINERVNSASGSHVLHVKAWNDFGDVCVSDVSIQVNAAAPPGKTTTPPPPANPGNNSSAQIPDGAKSVSNIQSIGKWIAAHDSGTKGKSSGTTGLTAKPALTGHARVFATKFDHYGGHRYATQFSDDANAQNFVYDTWFYIDGSGNGLSNLEFDLNQTIANGQTVIMGFQCDDWSHTWDYTANLGSAKKPHDKWLHSQEHCSTQEWNPNQWHHLQVQYSHDAKGWVTYQAVWLDGVHQNLGYRVFSAFALGWGQTLLTNFQVDSSKPGKTSATVLLDKLTIYRW